MTIYCDESGGLSAGAMCFAALRMDDADAERLLDRFREVTGLRGELKGSRIALIERAFFFELLERFGGEAWVSVVRREKLVPKGEQNPEDIKVYARLLETVLDKWQAADDKPGPRKVVIDDGRYDPRLQQMLREDVQRDLGQWGRASLADSRRVAGIQIADVVANTLYNLAIQSTRAERMRRILSPFIADRRVRVIELERL